MKAKRARQVPLAAGNRLVFPDCNERPLNEKRGSAGRRENTLSHYYIMTYLEPSGGASLVDSLFIDGNPPAYRNTLWTYSARLLMAPAVPRLPQGQRIPGRGNQGLHVKNLGRPLRRTGSLRGSGSLRMKPYSPLNHSLS